MKKTLLLILMVLLLAGCANAEGEEKPSVSASVLGASASDAAAVELPEARFNNAKKQYYTYYIPRGIGRQERNATSNLFIIYGNNAILNLDVASIVQAAHTVKDDNSVTLQPLRDIGSFTHPTFTKEGAYMNSSNGSVRYRIMVSDFESDYSYIIIQTEHFNFSSVCPLLETDEMIYEMIKILRTCTVDTEAIIRDYSYEETTADNFSIITLFREMLPESGYVVDYIEDWKNDSSFTIIDYSKQDEEPEDPGLPGDDVPDDLNVGDDDDEEPANNQPGTNTNTGTEDKDKDKDKDNNNPFDPFNRDKDKDKDNGNHYQP